jgi:magnesium chelatase family protein
MVVQIFCSALQGISAQKVTIEVHCTLGVGYHLVGMADNAIRESTYRIAGALQSVGYKIPGKKFIINMAPADLRKSGAHYDLPLAIGILLASSQLSASMDLDNTLVLGELALDGTLRPLKGVLPIVLAAKNQGFISVILPKDNIAEASIVPDLEIYGLQHLSEVLALIQGKSPESNLSQKDQFDPSSGHFTAASQIQSKSCNRESPTEIGCPALAHSNFRRNKTDYDFAMVRGQETVKRAIEIAASGGHNLLMMGPPGSGKTLLARCLPSILPPLNYQEALETTTIHSVMGQDLSQGLIFERPFRSPHHSISDKALIGGGRYPMPGEISMAHNGVLFLDELPEFTRKTLEALRQPIEEGQVHLSRAQYSVTYPSSVMLVCSMNPSNERDGPLSEAYLKKISGPLLDRIDLHVEVSAVSFEKLSNTIAAESSAQIRQRVLNSRTKQIKRFVHARQEIDKGEITQSNMGRTRLNCNAQMTIKQLEQYCPLENSVNQLLEQAMKHLGLSARAYHRLIKVARTIADMADCPSIKPEHMAEALQYRILDRKQG